MGTVNSNHSTMKFLVVLSAAVAATQCAAVLPYAGLGYGYGGYGIHAVPSVAKSTIKYKTGAFEKVDAATPADAVKIELVETEHEQDIYTPTISYATHGYGLGYPYGLVHAVAPEVEVKEVELPKLALPYGGYGLGAYGAYGLGGLGYYGHGLGLPYALPVAAAAEEAAAEE